ncbi:MAG: arginine deiminase-related protein [Candidatus Aenigmatarchaeota archaeon]
MKLNIRDEFSPLKKVIVGRGDFLPEFDVYKTKDPEFLKFVSLKNRWNKKILLRQHETFLKILKKHSVELLFPETDKNLPWQMYTRDIGFVYHDKFFFCHDRKLKEREGEFDCLSHIFSHVNPKNIIKIDEGKVEAGDVLIDKKQLYIGISSRTNTQAVKIIEKHFPVKTLYLGDHVMHLDARMAILPNKQLLIYTEAFQEDDLEYLRKKFEFIPITKKEAVNLGTNVFSINPETVVVNKADKRIQKELKARGFKIESIDYSESITLAASFRCATLPIERV